MTVAAGGAALRRSEAMTAPEVMPAVGTHEIEIKRFVETLDGLDEKFISDNCNFEGMIPNISISRNYDFEGSQHDYCAHMI